MNIIWPEWIKQKKVAIYGLGLSGLKTIELLQQAPCELFCANKGPVSSWFPSIAPLSSIKEQNCRDEDSPDIQEFLGNVDLIILSPGIPREHKALTKALLQKIPIWSEIELAFGLSPKNDRPIVAVTGTNGKTTTVTLMEQILKNSGYNPFIGGNIGNPFCQYILDLQKGKQYDIIVLELSSFQLESIEKFCPNVGVFLNLSLTHLERYRNLQEYAEAKFRLTKNMRPDQALIYPRSNTIIDKWAQRQRIILFPFESSYIREELESSYDLSTYQLPGQHNLENLYCAHKALSFLGLNLKGMQKTISQFTGVSYRIQNVPKTLASDHFDVYNDAKSTNIDATLKAITAVKKEGKKLYLIYGGQKRDKTIPLIFPKEFKENVHKLFLIGETTDELFQLGKGELTCIKAYTFEEAIKIVRSEEFGGTVLFSPGFPSFDQFKDYKDRGKKFETFFIKPLE